MIDILRTATARLQAQRDILIRRPEAAMHYALTMAGDGMEWLRRWSACDIEAREELLSAHPEIWDIYRKRREPGCLNPICGMPYGCQRKNCQVTPTPNPLYNHKAGSNSHAIKTAGGIAGNHSS